MGHPRDIPLENYPCDESCCRAVRYLAALRDAERERDEERLEIRRMGDVVEGVRNQNGDLAKKLVAALAVIERLCDHFENSVAALDNGAYGKRLIQEARALSGEEVDG